MSIMASALNNWLKLHGASVMRQEATVCDRFPPRTREAMIDISIKSADILREIGAPITQDFNLGKTITGTRTQVPIPKPTGTIGTYHTHPFGWAKPSTYDIIEAMNRDDKVTCIGASGKIGTKIACFTPKDPTWSDMRYKLRLLADDINDFNKEVGAKYRKRGIDLKALLKAVNPERHNEGVMLERRRQKLIDEVNIQLLHMGYKEEWRPEKKVNGWQAEPIMLDSCKILWETIDEELEYEL